MCWLAQRLSFPCCSLWGGSWPPSPSWEPSSVSPQGSKWTWEQTCLLVTTGIRCTSSAFFLRRPCYQEHFCNRSCDHFPLYSLKKIKTLTHTHTNATLSSISFTDLYNSHKAAVACSFNVLRASQSKKRREHEQRPKHLSITRTLNAHLKSSLIQPLYMDLQSLWYKFLFLSTSVRYWTLLERPQHT